MDTRDLQKLTPICEVVEMQEHNTVICTIKEG